MVLAIRFYDVGLRDDAVFWFYAAKDRYLTLDEVVDVAAAVSPRWKIPCAASPRSPATIAPICRRIRRRSAFLGHSCLIFPRHLDAVFPSGPPLKPTS